MVIVRVVSGSAAAGDGVTLCRWWWRCGEGREVVVR